MSLSIPRITSTGRGSLAQWLYSSRLHNTKQDEKSEATVPYQLQLPSLLEVTRQYTAKSSNTHSVSEQEWECECQGGEAAMYLAYRYTIPVLKGEPCRNHSADDVHFGTWPWESK